MKIEMLRRRVATEEYGGRRQRLVGGGSGSGSGVVAGGGGGGGGSGSGG